jgi:folate-binding protein YgfZ
MLTGPPDYAAALTGTIVVDRSPRGKLVVSGADRRSYLHAMLTNDILALTAGRGCYAAYLTPQGRMIADMHVLDLGDVILLDLDAGIRDVVLEKLDQFIFAEDVHLGDVTAPFGALALAGPASADVLGAVVGAAAASNPTGADLARFDEFWNVRVGIDGEALVIAGSRELASQGFNLYIDRARVADLEQRLEDRGAIRASDATAEILRIERGRPLFPFDLDADTIPLEAGIEQRAISFTKGCYPGQEVITRVLHRGHGRVARKLVGLVVEGGGTVGRGDPIHAGDREIGRVTSAAFSPRLERALALGYVHRDFLAPATPVQIIHHGQPLPAVVSSLPFVSDLLPTLS